MSLMKYAVVSILFAIVVTNAEEAKSSQNNSPLTSASEENKQQNKRLATYGSPSTLNSGFRPITTSYPSVNNYFGNPQLYTSAASNIYSKATPSYSPYYASSSEKFSHYKAPAYPAYQQYPQQYSQYQQQYQHYQPLVYAASHPSQAAYAQPPNGYAYSSVSQGPQIFPQQNNYNSNYGYNNAQPINPVLHAAPIASFANSYQAPAHTFYVNPQHIHKAPVYNQQPQTFNVASYQPSNYHHQVKQFSQSSPPSQIITSKPVALESSISPPASSSHVEHNHGAVSYAHFTNSGERKPSAAPLIATQTPQQVYYHQQPQPIYSGDYNKRMLPFGQQYASVPIASNYYPAQGGVHYSNLPYAHISKVQFTSPTAASTLIPSVAPGLQKVAFH